MLKTITPRNLGEPYIRELHYIMAAKVRNDVEFYTVIATRHNLGLNVAFESITRILYEELQRHTEDI